MKCLTNMERITISYEMVMKLISLYQLKGKEFYYDDILKDRLADFSSEMVEQNSFFVAKLFKLDISEARLKLLTKKNLVAKNKEEILFNNIKKSFNEIQYRLEEFEYTPNQFLDFARFLYKGIQNIDFNKENYIDRSGLHPERKTKSKRDELDNLLKEFVYKLNKKDFELTSLITNFYIDLINMKIFTSRNEEIGLLILYIVLFKEGFNLFSYTSFFNVLYREYDSFKKTVLQANFNWDEGYSQTKYLNTLIIDIILKCYKKLEGIVSDYVFEKNLNKSDSLENIILKFDDLFTKDDIRNKYPFVSDSTINRTLKRLRDENKIKPLGTGRSARWIKTVENTKKIKTVKIRGLFDDED